MNSLPHLTPPLLAPTVLPGNDLLQPITGPARGQADSGQQAASWLDAGSQGRSEPLHVGPNSRPRAIDDVERDFVRALCRMGPDQPA